MQVKSLTSIFQANAAVPMCTCNTFGCNANDDCDYCSKIVQLNTIISCIKMQFITETKCYDCGNDDQCANEEDNGQLRACPTGSMCYHTSGCKFCKLYSSA